MRWVRGRRRWRWRLDLLGSLVGTSFTPPLLIPWSYPLSLALVCERPASLSQLVQGGGGEVGTRRMVVTRVVRGGGGGGLRNTM